MILMTQPNPLNSYARAATTRCCRSTDIMRAAALAWRCASSACARSARLLYQCAQAAVRTLALALLKLTWTQHSNRFRSALNDCGSAPGALLEHRLDSLDGLLELLIRHCLNALILLNFELARDQQRSILRYAAGWSRATFSIAFLPSWRKVNSSACMNSWCSK